MFQPVPIDKVALSQVCPTRRIPVRELRAKGWRINTVDHATVSLINDKLRHETVDVVFTILLSFQAAARSLRMWKRDVSTALGGVQLLRSTWSVLGCSYGSGTYLGVSISWHALWGGQCCVCLPSDWNISAWVVLTTARAPLSRYVEETSAPRCLAISGREASFAMLLGSLLASLSLSLRLLTALSSWTY